jgi:hypothetical protein
LPLTVKGDKLTIVVDVISEEQLEREFEHIRVQFKELKQEEKPLRIEWGLKSVFEPQHGQGITYIAIRDIREEDQCRFPGNLHELKDEIALARAKISGSTVSVIKNGFMRYDVLLDTGYIVTIFSDLPITLRTEKP